MSLKIKFTPTTFVLPPEGMHIARCFSVIDLGEQKGKTYHRCYPAVRIAWELPQTQMPDGQPLMASQIYSLRFTPRSNLLALLEGWRGKCYTPDERKQLEQSPFDLKRLLGHPCYLTIQYTYDRQHPDPWATVSHASPLPAGLECPPPINPPVYYDLDEHSEAAYNAVPDSIRQKINVATVHVPSPTVHPVGEAHAPSVNPAEPNTVSVNPIF